MGLFVSTLDYWENTADPDWGATGSIFIRVYPNWAINDGINHTIIGKTRSAFTLHFFGFSKLSDTTISIGFFDSAGSGDTRISAAASSAMTTATWGNHVFTWDTAAPALAYYANNSLLASSASAFSVPTSTDRIVFGHINTGAPDQTASVWIAEHARWNRVLSEGERQTLQVTGCPLFVPNGLVEYHPFRAEAGGGRDLIGTTQLTQTASGSGVELVGYSVIYPSVGRMASLTATSGDTLFPPLLDNTITLFAPVVASEGGLLPPLLTNTLTLFAPSLVADNVLTPPLLTNSFTLYAPSLDVGESSLQEDSRELEPHNLRVRITEFVAGDDLRITRLYTGLTGNIIISYAYLTIKSSVSGEDASALLQLQITTNETTAGKITDELTTGGSVQMHFDLTAEQTATFEPFKPYYYDVQLVTSLGAIYTAEMGRISMQKGITSATS